MHVIHQCHGDKLMIYCVFLSDAGGGRKDRDMLITLESEKKRNILFQLQKI